MMAPNRQYHNDAAAAARPTIGSADASWLHLLMRHHCAGHNVDTAICIQVLAARNQSE